MQFSLFYRGPLKSNARPKDKHRLRRFFHEQLSALWKQKPLEDFRHLLKPQNVSNLSILRSVPPYTFAPLITERNSIVAEISVFLLRPQRPGSIIMAGGDLDNRLKTLLDALRMPRVADELPTGSTPRRDEDPFHCVFEDDSLITRIALKSDRLLAATTDPNEVVLTVEVRTIKLGGQIGLIGF